MSDPDVHLMIAFQKGDYDAFSELFRRYDESVVNYFFFQAHDRDLAEDCTQEVWGKIFRSKTDYEPRARFSTYLFRVARNHWIDRYRSLSRRPSETSLNQDGDGGEVDGTALGDRIAAPEDTTPESEIQREELARVLAAGLQRLPPEMREVYILGEVQGLPYAEISRVLSIPVGTVKSRMFNAVRKLKDVLGRFSDET